MPDFDAQNPGLGAALCLKMRWELDHPRADFLAAWGRAWPGSECVRRNMGPIDAIVRRTAMSKGVRIYHFVNVGNHLHLVIKLNRFTTVAGRQAFNSFIRAITGLIARHVLVAERNHAKGLKFWQARPFTRLVAWGRDYDSVSRYMAKNADQTQGRRGLVDWGFGITDTQRIINLDTG